MFYLLNLVTGMKQLMVRTQFTCMHYIFIWWLLYYLLSPWLPSPWLLSLWLLSQKQPSLWPLSLGSLGSMNRWKVNFFLLKSTAVPSSPLFSQYQRRKAQLKSWQKIPCANPINSSRLVNTDTIVIQYFNVKTLVLGIRTSHSLAKRP